MSNMLDSIDPLSRTVFQPGAAALTGENLEALRLELYKKLSSRGAFTREKLDPQLAKQSVALISFTASPGATPNEHGIFGTAKIRGAFSSEAKATKWAETLIRDHDSTNHIFQVPVGAPFPITESLKYSAAVDEVRLTQHTNQILKEQDLEKARDEERQAKEMVDRERKLLEENDDILSGNYHENPLDVLTTLHVKKANLLYTKMKTEEKMEKEIAPAIERVFADIAKLNSEYPELKEKYVENYKRAQQDVGINPDMSEDAQEFVKLLVSEAVE